MPIHLYAEHLVNIRTLSLQAYLSTVSNKETRATLSADGSTLQLAHEGEVASIKLPITVPGGHNDATLTIPAAPTKDLSFRISLTEKPGADGLLQNSNEDPNVIPWTAATLTDTTQISCKACDSTILDCGRVKVWKDLPSENWAEMMDFWHCHRPDVPHDHDHSAPRKGYSADSRLALESGVGMVDAVGFLLAREDCQHLQGKTGFSEDVEVLQCATCQVILGHVQNSSGGYKLRKMNLSLSTARDEARISYDANKWLACHLLSSMDSQGVRKFAIQSSNTAESSSLKLWIFAPDISISSSAADSPEPMRAVKILWKDSAMPRSEDGALNRAALSEGELEIPTDEMSLMRQALVASASLLPNSAKMFQDWKVALLPRFTSDNTIANSCVRPAVQLPEVPDLENKEILSALTE